jgi:hypothetical protein
MAFADLVNCWSDRVVPTSAPRREESIFGHAKHSEARRNRAYQSLPTTGDRDKARVDAHVTAACWEPFLGGTMTSWLKRGNTPRRPTA